MRSGSLLLPRYSNWQLTQSVSFLLIVAATTSDTSQAAAIHIRPPRCDGFQTAPDWSQKNKHYTLELVTAAAAAAPGTSFFLCDLTDSYDSSSALWLTVVYSWQANRINGEYQQLSNGSAAANTPIQTHRGTQNETHNGFVGEENKKNGSRVNYSAPMWDLLPFGCDYALCVAVSGFKLLVMLVHYLHYFLFRCLYTLVCTSFLYVFLYQISITNPIFFLNSPNFHTLIHCCSKRTEAHTIAVYSD